MAVAKSTSTAKKRNNEFIKVPIPADLADRKINFSDNARTVLQKRYLRRGDEGKPIETEQEMFWRVAYHVALAEKELGGDEEQVEFWARQFFDLLTNLEFFPNSPTFTGAGTPLGQLAACFVLRIDDDMGRMGTGIFETLRHAALIQQTGGGNGFSFSRLRPAGAIVKSSNGTATGPVGFLRVYDQAFGEIAQGGSRRGANMAVLRVDHPDIRQFIKCKTDEGSIANFNISVGITDEFMRCVEEGKPFDLINPQDGSVWETVDARELFDMIVEYAHHNGEPGVLFLDAANRENPVPHLYELESTNPCVTGDTLVATPDGWRRADEIIEGDEICTVLGTGRVATIEVHESIPVYDLYLSDGGKIRVTAAHQFHVRDSSTKFFAPKRLDEIEIGEWVRVFKGAIPNNPVQQGNVELEDRDYGFLVGALVGDGCYTPKTLARNVVRFSSHSDDEEWNTILQNAIAKVGTDSVKTYVMEGTRSMMMDPKPGRVIADWVRSLPIEPALSREKTLPESYINSNREFLVGLIDGLFSTDGSVDLASNHPLVRFHTASEKLAQQVRRILLMFGIHGRIHSSMRKRHDIDGRVIRHDRPKYDVVIVGESFGRFFEQICLSHPDKQYRMEEAALKCNFTGGNWAAKVEKIEPAGVAKVYDLYEPHSDTWITEGYVSRGCGEQFLGPFENCCLGSVNLSQHVTDDNHVDWDKLAKSVSTSTRFLDDVVTANKYVPAIPQLREAAENVRRIGLGIMGLADMMYCLGVRYGSVEGQEFASQVMEFVRYHCMKTSVELAEERGPFLAIEGSRYDPNDLKWIAPEPIIDHKTDWNRPTVNWKEIESGIRQHGIRNGAQTTVAPTGTIATVTGCEGYGCEPVFALAYMRYVNTNAGNSMDRMTLQYTSPLFERALLDAGLDQEAIDQIVDQVNTLGSCQEVMDVPENIRRVFVTSGDITAEEHIRMQAALQAHTDNAISKTCNFPEGASEDDVAQAYLLGWKLGCKGLTVYVTGSRDVVVLETKETKEKREGTPEVAVVEAPKYAEPQPLPLFRHDKAPRPGRLKGKTFRIATPAGTAYITINENGDGKGQPFEVFMHTAKAGSETAAVSEALGRLISQVLRMSSPVSPRNRVRETVRQLKGIGGGRQTGFGPNRVASLPDGLAQVLEEYLVETEDIFEENPSVVHYKTRGSSEQIPLIKDDDSGQSIGAPQAIGDLCPECGSATLIREEGCLHCYTCGYSEC
jgi:ribonucleotide reductase alpha subunit